MKKIVSFVLFFALWMVPCFGVTRQEKDALANAFLANFMAEEDVTAQEVSPMDCPVVAFLVLSDVLLARIKSGNPRQNDLVDRCLSQCDPLVLQRIVWLEAHPQELRRLWQELWSAAPKMVQKQLLQEQCKVSAALTAFSDARNALDTLVVLAKEWEESDESPELLATERFAPLRILVDMADEAEVATEDFDLAEAAEEGDKRVIQACDIIKKHYAFNPLALYEKFKNQLVVDADKALQMLPQLIIQGGVIALALASNTSIKECARTFKVLCAADTK